MRYLWIGAALVGVIAAFAPTSRSGRVTILLTGDGRGSLGPCGCTKPMIGGLARLATAVKVLSGPETALVANAAVTGGLGKQEELKAQTFAAEMSLLHCDAIRLGDAERLVPEMRLAVENIDGEAVLSDGHPAIEKGTFLITGLAEPDALRDLAAQAHIRNKILVVLLDGGRKVAAVLAHTVPGIALIQFREDGRADAFKVGLTLLVTPGSKLRDLAVVTFDAGVPDVKVIPLEAKIADDPLAKKVMDTYLQRIDQFHLLAKAARLNDAAFSGSQKCAPCHAHAYRVWRHSGHALAYHSLQKVHHGQDPECVPCHVVGLTSRRGFVSALKTPQLASVGCENCHGGSTLHVLHPRTSVMPKLGPRVCLSCHTTDQSPGFNFDQNWKLVKH